MMTVQTRVSWLTPEMVHHMHAVATTPDERELMAHYWLRGMARQTFDALTVDEQATIAGLMVRAVHRLREEANG